MSLLDLASGAAVLQFWMEKDAGSDIEGELDPVLDQLLEELEGSIENKVEAYCRIIRELELTQAARKEESDRIRKLADQDGNTVKAMKGRLMFFFGLQKISKLKTPCFNLSICANGGHSPIEVTIPPDQLPAEFQKLEIKPNMETIREALKMGTFLVGVTELARGTHLRIK
jgi:hypothetical protein